MANDNIMDQSDSLKLNDFQHSNDSGFGMNDMVFDVCIAGTGLPECLIGAALAVRGYKVLQIDSNGYYGGPWTSFNLDELIKWCNNNEAKSISSSVLTSSSTTPWNTCCRQYPLDSSESCSVNDIFIHKGCLWFPFTNNDTCNSTKEEQKKNLISQSSRFNIDLVPRLIYSESPETQLLIQSGVSRYLEFRGMEELKMLAPQHISSNNVIKDNNISLQSSSLVFTQLPVSKNVVFQDGSLSPIEKRHLMKFFTSMIRLRSTIFKHENSNYGNNHVVHKISNPSTTMSAFLSPTSAYANLMDATSNNNTELDSNNEGLSPEIQKDTLWSQYLQLHHNLSIDLRHRITYGLGFKTTLETYDEFHSDNNHSITDIKTIQKKFTDWTLMEGLQTLHTFTSSFGKYLTGAFIYPVFGTADLPQAFARLAAVYKGVFMLRTSITDLYFTNSVNTLATTTTTQKNNDSSILQDTTADLDDNYNNDNNNNPTGPYYLRKPLSLPLIPINNDGEFLVGLRLSDGQLIQTKKIITSSTSILASKLVNNNKLLDNTKENNKRNNMYCISRIVAITNTPLLHGTDSFQGAVAIYPDQHPIQVLQLDQYTGCCAKNTTLLVLAQVHDIKDHNDDDIETSSRTASIDDNDPFYGSMINLLKKLLASKALGECLCLFHWTQIMRQKYIETQGLLNNNVIVLPDPSTTHSNFVFHQELETALKVLNMLLIQGDNLCTTSELQKPLLTFETLIPQPIHVDEERRLENAARAKRPYEHLSNIFTSEL